MVLDGKRVISLMVSKGYRVLARNVVYIGSCSREGELAPQQPDAWNDLRSIITDKGEVIFKQRATIRPGQVYMDNPMNAAGCALLAYGQHRDGWCIGTHGYSYPHDALVQCDNIKVHRVIDGSFSRASKPVNAGADCGINHHSTCPGYDGIVGNWSAGCCVGVDWDAHHKFIDLLIQSGRQTFDVTLLPWRLTFGDGQMNPNVSPLV